MKVSVTGTRDGMTAEQWAAFAALLLSLEDFTQFHHGRCVGVDIQAARHVDALWQPRRGRLIVAHPGLGNGELEADDPYSDEERLPRSNFARNRDLVDLLGDGDLLVVMPKQPAWQDRGGTWFTHDYAVKRGKRIFIVWPNGTTAEGGAKDADAK